MFYKFEYLKVKKTIDIPGIFYNTHVPFAHRRSWFVLRSRATIAIVRDYLLIVDKLTFIEIFGDTMIKS